MGVWGKPVRILMVSEFFPPVMGGMERHVEGLCRALAARGHTVKVATLGWKGMVPREYRDGYEVHRIVGLFQVMGRLYSSRERRFHPPLVDPVIAKTIATMIKNFRPDVIHCHGWMTYSAIRAKENFGRIPLIVTLHDYGFICPKRTLMNSDAVCTSPWLPECSACAAESLGFLKGKAAYWAIRRKTIKAGVNQYIAVSNYVKDMYTRQLNLPKGSVVVIPNFYTSDDEHEISAEHALSLPEKYILFVGTLSKEKGVHILVEAFKMVRTDVSLVLIGMERDDFSYPVSDKILVFENQPHGVVIGAWRRCMFGVIPSVWPDPCPTVALEAMASGKAVIASNVGGLPEIVLHESTGIIVPGADVEAMAIALRRLLAEPEVVQNMGRNGRARFNANFTEGKVMQKVVEMYWRAVNAG